MTVSGLNYSASSASSASFTGKKFGKVTMLNGDGSIITTGTIVPVMQYFGRNQTVTTLQIRSNDDGLSYEQADWIAKYDEQVDRESIYASDPEASKAFAEKIQKAIDAALTVPSTPRPVRRTVARSPECEWF
jgi:hypothetical protein